MEAVEGLTLKMVALRAGAMLLNVALNTIVSTVANFVITKFNEWRTAIETNAQKSKELSSSMTDLISQYKELGGKSGWDTDDFAQAKDLNAEILDLLKNQSAEMDKKLRKLDLENGKYQEQIDLLNELSISTLTQNKADQGKLLEQTAKGKSSGQYVIGDSSDTDMANALGGKFGGSLDSNTGVFNFGGFDSGDADSILAYYDKLSNALDYLGSNYDSATLEASSLYNQLKSEKNAIEDAAEEFKSAMSDLKEILSSVLSIFEKFNDNSNNDLKIWGDVMNKVIDKRIEALNKQKEALEENNEATERAIELSKAQDALARAQQQRTTRVYTENGYEWQANAEDVRTAREDLADKQREWNKKDAEKAIDDQIKKYNEFKDKLSEVMDDIGKSWKDYQKELEYTAQIQKMSLSQMEGSLDGYHNKIIASLNTGSAITSIQNLITNLESLINTLTKVNNLYSAIKTGEYKDLGTKGLWNTIKGFFNKGGEEAAAESGKTVETFFEVLKNKVQTSGNGLIDKFKGIWEAIKAGAQNTFKGSGGGIVSTVIDGFKTIGDAVSKSKVGSTLIKGAGKLVTGAGRLIKSAVGAIGAAGTSAIPVVGAVAATAGLAIYGTAKNYKHQKEIWSNKEDGFGKKALKSVATFIWDTSPIGAVVNLCKDIFGKSKETAENTKDTANSSSETAENTKKATGVTNLTINATQGTISEENKTEESAPEEKKQSAWDRFWGSKLWFWNWGKKASGDKKIKHSGTYNVDEAGPEMLVRQPASGRYTYLETGDGVVPADITSRLFEMGGNPDKWFSDQLAKNSSASMVQSRSSGGISLSIGDVNVNNPVGDSDALASELVNRLPNRIVQQLNKR